MNDVFAISIVLILFGYMVLRHDEFIKDILVSSLQINVLLWITYGILIKCKINFLGCR